MILRLKPGIKELWAPIFIKGKITIYNVSTHGNVINRYTKQKMSQRLSKKGYPCVTLNINSEARRCEVHLLVARAFIVNNNSENDTVDHDNCDKTYNHFTNLQWMSRSENSKKQHRYRVNYLTGSEHGMAILNVEMVHEICKYFSEGKSTKYISEKLSISSSLINDIKRKRTWTEISDNYKFDLPKAKLSEAQVLNISEMILSWLSDKEIATKSNCVEGTIQDIRLKRVWSSVTKDYDFKNRIGPRNKRTFND